MKLQQVVSKRILFALASRRYAAPTTALTVRYSTMNCRCPSHHGRAGFKVCCGRIAVRSLTVSEGPQLK
ncbi:hypothetical protein E2C01_023357 [Portunus trituberculatus]|uniref:Uncharacterized protein n=1 Tax=Portunus trituberculatus TaxID=210409 RepID=A0A5B7E7T0_PORTR|nr:hypothetical protein [Portunus trituberculatus]